MSRFAKYAWFIVLYLVLVILWGAVVRATGSGAGCGNHWPTCNGEIIHRPEQIETLIELSHRLTSGFAGILVLGLLIWAFRKQFQANQKFIRWMAVLTFVFIIIEGGLGAALVRFELVGENTSVERAIIVALHLGNTLILLAFATLTAWGASVKETLELRSANAWTWGIVFGLFAYIFLCAIGAVTALGDTLFPVETLSEGLQQDLDPTAHFLIQLRVWHPVVAILVSGYLSVYGYFLQQKAISKDLQRLLTAVFGLIVLQVAGGFLNVFLLAPVVMQVIHLLLADSLWIVLVVFAGTVLTQVGDEKVNIAV